MNQKELLEVYFEETSENLEEAERCIMNLEKVFSVEEFNGLFRCIHTIKGGSAAVEFNEISGLAHKLEDILNHVRDGKLEFNLDNSNLCFNSISEELGEHIRSLYGKIQKGLLLEDLAEELLVLMKELSGFLNIQLFMIHSNSYVELFSSTHELYESFIYKIYSAFKNKAFFKYVELQGDKENIERLDNISSKLNKKTFKHVFLDVSKVEILESDELKKLIKVNSILKEDHIGLSIINGGKYRKRLFNIFEAINDFNNIKQYKNETNAALFFKK